MNFKEDIQNLLVSIKEKESQLNDLKQKLKQTENDYFEFCVHKDKDKQVLFPDLLVGNHSLHGKDVSLRIKDYIKNNFSYCNILGLRLFSSEDILNRRFIPELFFDISESFLLEADFFRFISETYESFKDSYGDILYRTNLADETYKRYNFIKRGDLWGISLEGATDFKSSPSKDLNIALRNAIEWAIHEENKNHFE